MLGSILSIFGGRGLILVAVVAALGLVVVSAKLDAIRVRSELANVAAELVDTRQALDRAMARADTAEKQLAQANAAVTALERRMSSTQSALKDAASLERRLRAEAQRKRPGRSANRARDAVEWLRAREPDATDTGARREDRAAGP